jgi:hypothetical protein
MFSRTRTGVKDGVPVMSTATVSPTLAASGTGSNPPATTTVVTDWPVASFVIVARMAPAGTDAGGNET